MKEHLNKKYALAEFIHRFSNIENFDERYDQSAIQAFSFIHGCVVEGGFGDDEESLLLAIKNIVSAFDEFVDNYDKYKPSMEINTYGYNFLRYSYVSDVFEEIIDNIGDSQTKAEIIDEHTLHLIKGVNNNEIFKNDKLSLGMAVENILSAAEHYRDYEPTAFRSAEELEKKLKAVAINDLS